MEHRVEEHRRLTMLIVICDRGKDKKITAFFKDRNAAFSLLTMGKGTASSKMLSYLGLGQVEKAVIFSVMSDGEARDVLLKIDEKLDLKRPGHGIAFTLPVCGDEEEGQEMGQEFRHALILAVVNRGYNQEVVDAARTAEASGGTIIHARGLPPSGDEKFFGVSIQPEKEVIMILAEQEKKGAIMKAIAEKAGAGTPVGAITFSMPVSDVQGLQAFLPQEER
jgi:nitrogen regulatory protein PII